MSLSSNEQKFITHIRTLHLIKKSSRKDKPLDYVTISVKNIKEEYFPTEYEIIFDKLKNLKEIDYQKVTLQNNSYYFKFKVLKDGPVDFSLLKTKSRKLDNLELTIKSNLRWVSIEDGVNTTIYFEHFLNHKENQLDAFFLIDEFSGRVHTPITSLKSTIREHLLIKNENTISLDVAQMQPLLLAHILQENIGDNEFSKWIDEGHDIYEMFMKNLKLKDRNEAKTKFYEITFGKANQKLSDMFGNSKWIEWINNIKSNHLFQNPNTIRKPHSNLAWLLQTTEVAIMRSVWQKLVSNDILFLTVHDEVIVRESDAEETFQVVTEQLKFYFKTFKVNMKNKLSHTKNEICLEDKVKKINPNKMYYPYELYEKFNINEIEILEAIHNNLLEETFPECYRRKQSI